MTRCLLFSFVIFTFTTNTLASQTLPAFEAMDVFGLEWVSDPQISPDGEQIVYIRNGMDIMRDRARGNIWMVNANGSGHRKMTLRDGVESNPRWSPDGAQIAFISKDEVHGNELFVYWMKDGKSARVSQLVRSPQNLAWSPDGKQLSFTMLVPEKPPVLVKDPEKPKGAEWAEKPRVTTRLYHEADGKGHIETGYRHIFVIPAVGGSARQVTSGDFQHDGQYSWAHDGESIIFSANRHPDHEIAFYNSELYQLDLNSSEITPLTDRFGPDRSPVISADGKQVAWRGFDDKVQAYQVDRLYVMNVDGSEKQEIVTNLDHSISGLVWSKDGRGLYYQYDHHGNTKVGYTTLSGKVRIVAENMGGTSIGRPYGGGSFSVAVDSSVGVVAYTHTTPYHPAELAIVSKPGTTARLITELNADLLGQRNLARAEEIWYKSTFDQRQIQGWIVKPPDYQAGKSYPLIVENHGGPISNYGDRFSPEIQLYASAGYIVFYPNPRGSTSYGEEFANLLYNNYPGEDYQDVMDGVDTIIAAGLTTEDQLYVTGGSAGGIMTAWIVGKNNRFQAAAVVKPVMNWVSKLLVADNYFRYAQYRYPGQVWENFENYIKFSPISLVGNIETPTMVMVGTEDLRTPLSEAKQLYHALKVRQIDTALVEIPGAYHLIVKRPSQLIAKVQHVLAWFDKYPIASPE